MELAIITKSLSTSSGSRAPIELAVHLAKICDITIFSESKNAQSNLKEFLVRKKIRLVLYKNPFDLYSSLKNDSFDLISFHATLPEIIAAKLAGHKIVRTYYGTQFDAYLERFLPNQKPPVTAKISNYLANAIIWIDQKLMLFLSSQVIAISKAAQKELEEHYKQKSQVIYLGSNLKPVTSYQLQVTSYQLPVTILSVSRFTPYKGFHQLIDAVKSIREEGTSVRLIIAGSPEKKNYLAYLKKIKDPQDQIIVAPDDKTLKELYQQCDIVASCDRYPFFGLSLLEAAQFAKPTVALNHLAAKELVIHSQTGYLANSPDELIKYLKNLAKNSLRAQKMGQSAQKFAQKNFNFEKIATAYQNRYHAVHLASSINKGRKLNKNSNFKAKIVLILIGILLPIIILEIYARLVISKTYTQTLPSFFQENPYSVVELQPNVTRVLKSKKSGEFSTVVQINNQGLRNDYNYQIPKPKNTFRILMLGDSYTFGYGVQVEETFSKVLEKSLNQKYPKTHFEVINAGFASGFTWDEAYLYVKENGLIFEPDIIIENAFLGNDIIDFGDHYYEEIDGLGLPLKIASKTTYVSNGSLRSKPSTHTKGPKLFLAGAFNKFFCDSLAMCRQIIRPLIDRNVTLLLIRLNPKSFSPDFKFFEEKLSPEVENYWQTAQKILLGLNNLAQTKNSQFMVVNIPIKEQLYDPNNLIKNQKMHDQRLLNFLLERHIPYCDAKEKLSEQSDKNYFKYDSHLTPMGHEKVSKAIENCINMFFT